MAKELKVEIKHYPDLGEVEYTCRKGLRNMRLRVKDGEPVKVSYPYHVTFKRCRIIYAQQEAVDY